jgi:tRNA modification GTPase
MDGDTIAAISTPIGEGGIGIVRLTGPDAMDLADGLFRSARGISLRAAPSHTLHYGRIVVDGRPIDEVLVSVLRAPRTYTREDMIEINCHGGVVATRAVLDVVLTAGARMAERGEFTKRAFLNGRISLDQAKAVLDVVRARTELGLEAAVDRLGGRFSGALDDVRRTLAEVLADLEVEIDYPDLDVDVEAVLPRIDALCEQVDRMLAQSEQGRIVREGLTVAIVGRPNVGKSTLLNALLAEERAIVTPIPGTTRDTVEEESSLGGIPVRWIDTAGLRRPTDPVEAEGIDRTERAIDRSDLVLCLVDRSEPLTAEDRKILDRRWGVPSILVVNKTDLPNRLGADLPNRLGADLPDRLGVALPTADRIDVSAKTGDGIEALTDAIVDRLVGGQLPTRNSVLLLDTWERDLIRRVGEALKAAAEAARVGQTPDMIAEELRIAFRTAGELQGIDVSESILDAVFERFCVGK